MPRRPLLSLIVVAAALAVLPPASARAEDRTQPVVPLAGAGPALGDAELRTTVEGGRVTVTAGAPAVAPEPGQRVVACVQTHVFGVAPHSACRTRSAGDPAPAATRQVAVPAPPGWGWATGFVEVQTASGERVASSWAPSGLATAAMPLGTSWPAGPPGPQGIVLARTLDGGLNTGARLVLRAAVRHGRRAAAPRRRARRAR